MTQDQIDEDGTLMTYKEHWDTFQDMPFLECLNCFKQNVKSGVSVGHPHHDYLLRLHDQRVANIGESRRCDCMEDVD